MGKIKLVRIYEHQQPQGYRILVDRLWPRGMSKVRAKLDEWDKQMGPTKELRQWFNHEDAKFPAFEQKYKAELARNPFTPTFLATVKQKLRTGDVLFLFGAKNQAHNQAVVLKKYVKEKL